MQGNLSPNNRLSRHHRCRNHLHKIVLSFHRSQYFQSCQLKWYTHHHNLQDHFHLHHQPWYNLLLNKMGSLSQNSRRHHRHHCQNHHHSFVLRLHRNQHCHCHLRKLHHHNLNQHNPQNHHHRCQYHLGNLQHQAYKYLLWHKRHHRNQRFRFHRCRNHLHSLTLHQIHRILSCRQSLLKLDHHNLHLNNPPNRRRHRLHHWHNLFLQSFQFLHPFRWDYQYPLYLLQCQCLRVHQNLCLYLHTL